MARLLGDAAHGVEDKDGELGAYLVGVEIRRLDRPAQTRRCISGPSLIHHERDNVIGALLTGAKLRVALGELHVNLANHALQRTLHPAMGSGCRSRTMVPVNVDPVVPVSSTL
jgi:hypothetical protein